MELKDHYTILEVTPSASPDEIRKAYRRLAQLYHPDKNSHDQYATARFTEIKEAYETLTNPARKDQYLQQRWYAKSTGARMTSSITSPVTVLKRLLELERYVRTLDVHRLDQEGLYHYLSNILSPETMEMLETFQDTGINREITRAALHCLQPVAAPLATPVVERLRQLKSDEETEKAIARFVHVQRFAHKWDKRRPWIILLAGILLCVILFLLARS